MGASISGVAVVTGAGRGIGRAITDRLLADGRAVVAVGRRAETLAAPFADDARVRRAVADVADGPALAAAIEAALRPDEAVAVVVANAGICRTALLEAPDAAAVWRDVLATNLDGAFHTLRAVSPRLRAGARAIVVSSGLGKMGRAGGYAAYAASKHGVLGLVRCLAHDWAPRGVTVNAICPGWVDTEMARADAGDQRAAAEARAPLGRFVSATEVADLVQFLASPAAAAITGQAYNICGGEFGL